MRSLFVFPVLALLGCTGASDTGASCSDDDALVNWDNWGAGFFAGYCRTCHAAGTLDRHGAPESINFDTEAEARQFQDDVRRVVLENATMPVGGGVPDSDLATLDVFLRCGL
jgi:hypothetical protein